MISIDFKLFFLNVSILEENINDFRLLQKFRFRYSGRNKECLIFHCLFSLLYKIDFSSWSNVLYYLYYLIIVYRRGYESNCAHWVKRCALVGLSQFLCNDNIFSIGKHSTGDTNFITQFRALSSSVMIVMAIPVELITDFCSGLSLFIINHVSLNCFLLFILCSGGAAFAKLIFICSKDSFIFPPFISNLWKRVQLLIDAS